MIAPPLTARGMRGYVVRYLKVPFGFKIAIIVGYEPRDSTFRVRTWSRARSRWSVGKVKAALTDLEPLTADEAGTHRAMLRHAAASFAPVKAYWNHQ